MTKKQTRILLINVFLMSVTPLLFLYNQNKSFLSFGQVVIWCAILAGISFGIFYLIRAVFYSNTIAFFSCLVFVVLVFLFSSINDKISFISARLIFLLPILLSYIVGYVLHRIFGNFEMQNMPILAFVALGMLFLLNVIPVVAGSRNDAVDNEPKHKTSFEIKNDSPMPNVYWLFCDGMLGFDAMEKYFGDRQEVFVSELTERGFEINKSAQFESGHWTRISIPVLMCPDYYDAYLSELMKDHEHAISIREKSAIGMDIARKLNETEMAFDSKGYTTVTISVNGPFFYPTADYYYYIKARGWTKGDEDFTSAPKLIIYTNQDRFDVDESRMCAYQLGEIFLGGIPGEIYDSLFPDADGEEADLATSFDSVDEVLCGASGVKINTELVTSLYDAIHSPNVLEPKFVIVHNFLAHFPFDNDENGNKVEQSTEIMSYRGHHTYAAKVLINLLDMILESDPDAVIIIQGDHGLHFMSQEQIAQAFGADAEVDIWNSVISAIRVPEKYQNGEEKYALSNPLNISRYIVNSFVGKNYEYIVD